MDRNIIKTKGTHPVEKLRPETCKAMMEFLNDCYQIFLAKQNDRGPGNISKFGSKGIVLRMCDKQERIERIVWDEIKPEVSEPVENEYVDMATYCAIDSVVREGKWGK
jgi:hypothetical protein